MAQVTGQLTELEMEQQQRGERRTALQTQTEQSRQRLFDLAVERSQTESQLTNLDTKQRELLSRLQDIQDDQAHCRQERSNAEAALTEQNVLLQQVTQHLAVDREKHETLSAARLKLEERLQEVDQQWIQEQTNRAAAESRLPSTASRASGRVGISARPGRKRPLPATGVSGGQGKCSLNGLKVPQEYEVAIEAALGEHIRAWVVDGVDDVLQALAFVTEHGWGSWDLCDRPASRFLRRAVP